MIGGAKPDASAKTAPEPAHGASEVQAANPPPETAKAETDVAAGGTTPPVAGTVVADLGPSAPSGGDEVMVEAFVATPRPRAETEGSAYLLPSSSVVELAKDKAMS